MASLKNLEARYSSKVPCFGSSQILQKGILFIWRHFVYGHIWALEIFVSGSALLWKCGSNHLIKCTHLFVISQVLPFLQMLQKKPGTLTEEYFM